MGIAPRLRMATLKRICATPPETWRLSPATTSTAVANRPRQTHRNQQGHTLQLYQQCPGTCGLVANPVPAKDLPKVWYSVPALIPKRSTCLDLNGKRYAAINRPEPNPSSIFRNSTTVPAACKRRKTSPDRHRTILIPQSNCCIDFYFIENNRLPCDPCRSFTAYLLPKNHTHIIVYTDHHL